MTGIPLATINMIPSYMYFHRKIEKKYITKRNQQLLIPHLVLVFSWQLEILVTALSYHFYILIRFFSRKHPIAFRERIIQGFLPHFHCPKLRPMGCCIIPIISEEISSLKLTGSLDWHIFKILN